MTRTAPEATSAKRVPGAPFFFLSFFSLFTLFFFAIYSKASSFPVSLLRLHISISRHLQFFYSSQEHAQVIIGFNERKQGKYRINFAMSLNIVYISRLLIIDQFT